MSDQAWMELCEVSTAILKALQSSEAVCLQCSSSQRRAELTTVIVEAIPSSRTPDEHVVCMHPLLYEFLTNAAEAGSPEGLQERAVPSAGISVSIAPLPFHEYSGIGSTSLPQHQQQWTLSRVAEVVDLPIACRVSITCIYHENDSGAFMTSSSSFNEQKFALALEGRLIRENSLLLLPTLAGVCIVTVSNITGNGVSSSEDVVYRVGSSSDFELDVTGHADSTAILQNSLHSEWKQNCPGYNELLEKLVSLSQLTGIAAPAGVLLTGCAGVGKSCLASCLAHRVSTSKSMHVQWVSAQDLLVRASWATEDDLLELLLPQKREKRCLLVIDDLQVLASEEEEESLYDPELLLVHNSILEALSRLSTVIPLPFILGIAHKGSQLPKELVKIGRLEKELTIEPPSQVQREEILASILADVMDNEKRRRRWSETLASQTAGCVASDLRRLSADVWTRAWSRSPDNVEITWNDLRDAAHTCVPSQLAQLDVTKTPVFPHEGDGPPDPQQIHEWSWRNFGGYHEVKKRLYRTVVMPWRRFIARTGRENDSENDEIRDSWVTPPSGVLFHGSPGVGKTVAASCLASSLELHVVKVRASDVLDQWLGGSEAAIRSLFSRARAASPCMLFFDEIDAIACNREDDGSSVDVASRILTTFLNEMDGISSGGSANGGVLVVACTNRIETLDAALLRPGRLDEHVLLPMPTLSDVEEMLKLHLAKVPLSEDVDIAEIADLMVELNGSGADVEGACRSACSRAIREAAYTHQATSEIAVSNSEFLSAIREWRKYE